MFKPSTGPDVAPRNVHSAPAPLAVAASAVVGGPAAIVGAHRDRDWDRLGPEDGVKHRHQPIEQPLRDARELDL
jgi:hypothetical protein